MAWWQRKRPVGVRILTTHGRQVACRVRRLGRGQWGARPAERLRPGELVQALRFDRLPAGQKLNLLLGMDDIAE